MKQATVLPPVVLPPVVLPPVVLPPVVLPPVVVVSPTVGSAVVPPSGGDFVTDAAFGQPVSQAIDAQQQSCARVRRWQ
ncbi:MAG: hypothetical protein ACYCWW_16905 [Deltaproteobacteria bacterium]